jgi:hypothetical protein
MKSTTKPTGTKKTATKTKACNSSKPSNCATNCSNTQKASPAEKVVPKNNAAKKGTDGGTKKGGNSGGTKKGGKRSGESETDPDGSYTGNPLGWGMYAQPVQDVDDL